MSRSQPKYSLQKRNDGRNRAFVRIDGQRIYLGVYGSPESREKYDQVIERWRQQNEPEAPSERIAFGPRTVNELLAEFLEYAKAYYADGKGDQTDEFNKYRIICGWLHRLHGREFVDEFGPKKLKAMRAEMIERGWSRKYINDHVQRVKRIFRWGVSEELVPSDVYQTLASIEGLRKGRSRAKEPVRRKGVPLEIVEKTLPWLPEVVADMVRIQLLTAMRPTEMMTMRPCDIDRSRQPWSYRPAQHKLTHKEIDRVVVLGPRAQRILLKYLARDANDYLFSPRDSEAKRLAMREAMRKTPLSCGNRRRSTRRRQLAERYNKDTFRQAIRRAAIKAGVEVWTPYMLRHTQATRARAIGGLDASQAVLGHRHASTSELYAQLSHEKAAEIVQKIG